MPAGFKAYFFKSLRAGLLELLVVLLGLVFVRKEVYLAGKFQSMILHWQEYVFLILMFFDGVLRGFGEMQGQGQYFSPLRKRVLRFVFPVTLFLFVSCASLCDKLNAACIRAEWWRDLGLMVLLAGLVLSFWARLKIPEELAAEIELPMKDSEEAGPEADASAEKAGDLQAAVDLQSEPESPAASNALVDDGVEEAQESPLIDKLEDLGDTAAKSSSEKEIHCEGPWRILRYPARTALLLELVGVSMSLSAWLPLITLPGLFVLFKWELADLEAFRISQFGQKYLNYRKRSWNLIPYLY